LFDRERGEGHAKVLKTEKKKKSCPQNGQKGRRIKKGVYAKRNV